MVIFHRFLYVYQAGSTTNEWNAPPGGIPDRAMSRASPSSPSPGAHGEVVVDLAMKTEHGEMGI